MGDDDVSDHKEDEKVFRQPKEGEEALMFRVVIPLRKGQEERLLGISFTHPTKPHPFLPTRKHPALIRRLLNAEGPITHRQARSTICRIYLLGEDSSKLEKKETRKILSSSTVTCYVDTQFEKAQGRKQSLKRALFFTNLLKDERELVWQALFTPEEEEVEEGERPEIVLPAEESGLAEY